MTTATIVTIGKYKGQPFQNVPKDYAEWQRRNNNQKFYESWLLNTRYCKHNNFVQHTSPDGRWMERKLENGEYVFYIALGVNSSKGRVYYIVDQNGDYVRDLVSFGHTSVKQGAIDPAYEDWVTLAPNGAKYKGKMLVSPYFLHFPYETYIGQ